MDRKAELDGPMTAEDAMLFTERIWLKTQTDKADQKENVWPSISADKLPAKMKVQPLFREVTVRFLFFEKIQTLADESDDVSFEAGWKGGRSTNWTAEIQIYVSRVFVFLSDFFSDSLSQWQLFGGQSVHF